MIDGLDDVRSAAEALATRDERLKARLSEAGRDVWSAMYHADDWPPHLRERAERVQKAILAHGTVQESVAQMNVEEAKEVAGQILDLLIELERACSSRQPGPESVGDPD